MWLYKPYGILQSQQNQTIAIYFLCSCQYYMFRIDDDNDDDSDSGDDRLSIFDTVWILCCIVSVGSVFAPFEIDLLRHWLFQWCHWFSPFRIKIQTTAIYIYIKKEMKMPYIQVGQTFSHCHAQVANFHIQCNGIKWK